MYSCINLFFFLLVHLSYSKVAHNILDTDKMYISIGKEMFLINLIQNEVSEELISILPLKTKLIDENINEKRLSISTHIEIPKMYSSSVIKANKGDIMLYKRKELIILKESKTFSNDYNEYIEIGSNKEVEKLLSNISKNKTIYIWNKLNYENQKEKVEPYEYNSLMNFFTWKVFTFVCFILL